MIRNLLATTAIATLLATGAYAQSSTPTPPAAGEEPAKPIQDGSGATPDGGASTGDAAQGSTAAPADDTAQDSTTQPAADTAQGTTTMEPAEETAQDDAATTTDTQTADADMPEVEGQLASNLIGARVYNGAQDDAENIGEVNDIVIGKDGKAEFAVIGVGGFLGIGEKDVAIEYATLKWAERDGEMWLVLETSKEQLESQPAFDRTAYDPEAMAAEQQAATDAATQPAGTVTAVPPATTTEPADTATAPATTGEAMESEETATAEQPAEGAADDTAAAESAEVEEDKQTTETAEAPAAGAASTDQTQTAAIDRSTLQESDMGTIEAEEFVGTTVYGSNEEQVGEIGDVILSQDGQVDAVIIDVGGFLGMGEKQIAVGMDNLQFMEDGDGNRYLYTEWTQEQLEAQPEYDEATYADNRDTMRMTVE